MGEPVAERALAARCTLIVAAAGYGKTETVRRWLGTSPAQWCCGALPPVVDAECVVIDDLAAVPDDLEDLLHCLPAGSRMVVISRWPSGRTRPARRGAVAEHGPADLALTGADTAELLRTEYGVVDAGAAVHGLTAGWPGLVRLAGEQLAARPDVTTLSSPGAGIATFLDKHVLSIMPAAAGRLVRDLAHLGAWAADVVDEDLCRAIGHRRPDRTIAQLAAVGVLVTTAGRRHLVPLVAEVARERWRLSRAARSRLLGAAGDWYAANGRPHDGIRAFAHCGRWDRATSLLLAHGPTWVIGGGAPVIAATIAAMPAEHRDPAIRLLHGEALLILGEDDRALAELTALAEGEADYTLPAALAWRLGAVHYLRADPHTAMAIFARGRLSDPADTGDEALLLGWAATAQWMAGDAAATGDLARRALAAAELAGDDRARAAAHVALSMHAMLAGDRPANSAQLDHALRYAEAAGDIVQAARIHGNRSSLWLEEAQYPQALAEAARAQALAAATGYSAILAVALCNEGEALFRLGRMDEAARSYQRALVVFQQKGSHKVAYPLIGLGAIHRTRGRHNLARAAYEEAARAASATGDIQGVVPARAGLARVLAATDPVGAAAEAALARAAATGPFVTEALLGVGWAQLGAGAAAAATATAVEAATHARRHRDPRGLAEALELRVAALPMPAGLAQARGALREAAETWRLTGANLDVDRVCVALGALAGASEAERLSARLAHDRLEAAGVSLPAPAIADPGGAPAVPRIVVRSLGRFELSVDGVPVTMSMWQSRKARDLLRVLVARRGRATAREELTDLLWPGEDSERLSHRLSVALSTVRSVLDPDRGTDADHFVLADHAGIVLRLEHLAVDLELFLSEAAHGLALRDRGQLGEAQAALAAAEHRYTGDFLENEPYEDWSVAAREEARATYLRTVRTLAELSGRAGRVDDAVHYLLKVIDKDPYDEAAHRALVATLAAAGRHGESRRAQTRYVTAMREIGVDPGA